ncbi:MAG: preprotein translocase subunit SecE, partial [candidate division WOR-3 bacterium]
TLIELSLNKKINVECESNFNIEPLENIGNRFQQYIKNIYFEMKRVTWPTKNELVNSTIIVIVISIFVALVIFVLDRVFTALLGIVIR